MADPFATAGVPLRLTGAGLGRPPRPGPRQRFLKGPVPWDWVRAAARAPGQALAVGVYLWHRAGLQKAATVGLPLARLAELGVSKGAGRRGLAALERAGLVVVDRHPRRAARVTLRAAPPP